MKAVLGVSYVVLTGFVVGLFGLPGYLLEHFFLSMLGIINLALNSN